MYNMPSEEASQRRLHATQVWSSLGDRLVTLSATVLGLSALFLSKGVHLHYTQLLRGSWMAFSVVLVLGMTRLFTDFRAYQQHARSSGNNLEGNWWNTSLLLTAIVCVSFLIGLGFLLAFAWVNVGLLTGAPSPR